MSRSADRRSSRAARIGLLSGDQAAVPPQDGTGGDQPVCPQPSRQERNQRGQDRSVGPVEPGPGIGAAQHGDLVPQHQQFGVSWTPASGQAGQASRRAERRSDRAGGGTRLIIMPHGHAAPTAPGHRTRPTFGTRHPTRCGRTPRTARRCRARFRGAPRPRLENQRSSCRKTIGGRLPSRNPPCRYRGASRPGPRVGPPGAG
jgi:hypothetical protein